MVINQAYLFLIFTLDGLLIGLLFDFFRILRKTFKTINLITYIEDIIFWILTGISIIFCMYKFSGGSLRLFMFIGLSFGLIIYIVTLSKIIMTLFVSLFTIIKKITNKAIKIIITPLQIIYKITDKIIIRQIYLIWTKIQIKLAKKRQKIDNKLNILQKFKKNTNKNEGF